MGNGSTSIAGFLFEAGRDHLRSVEHHEGLAEVRTALSGLVPPISWPAARGEIERAVREAVDIKLDDLLLSTWVRSALLVRYLDSSKYPPDQPILAHLSEHTMKVTLRPSIEVYVSNVLVKTIPIEVQLSLVLKGFILTIKRQKIVQIATGSCQAKSKVTLAGVVLAEKALKPVALPGVIPLQDGTPIAVALA